jgi:hypothetical protein
METVTPAKLISIVGEILFCERDNR